jgi:hypothetical protein
MLGEVFAGLGALKAAFDITKALRSAVARCRRHHSPVTCPAA